MSDLLVERDGPVATLDLREAPHALDTPTLCALNGPAAGHGMDLALGCDIRIGAAEAVLAAAFTRRGVLPESAGTRLLPRMVGWPRAAEIVFTGHVHHVDLQLLPLFRSADFQEGMRAFLQEGMRAFLEKRKPRFEGR